MDLPPEFSTIGTQFCLPSLDSAIYRTGYRVRKQVVGEPALRFFLFRTAGVPFENVKLKVT